jgi:hypothetical protein
MIANPCEHSSILRLMCKVPWVVKNWPIQKLINRAHARSRFLAFFNANLDGLTLRQGSRRGERRRRSATTGARRELLQWRSASCSEVWTVPLSSSRWTGLRRERGHDVKKNSVRSPTPGEDITSSASCEVEDAHCNGAGETWSTGRNSQVACHPVQLHLAECRLGLFGRRRWSHGRVRGRAAHSRWRPIQRRTLCSTT